VVICEIKNKLLAFVERARQKCSALPWHACDSV